MDANRNTQTTRQGHYAFERFYPRDRSEWRRWLEQNHATSPGVWLVLYKKHAAQPTISYDDAVEEALCFGWIDSKANLLDEDRYLQLVSPRKRKSPWSKSNKQRIEKLIEQGLMADAGLAKIEAAKADGSWTAYDVVEDIQVPADLQEALTANPAALGHFQAFSDSTKKALLWHLMSAKRPETRQKRIREIVDGAAQNRNPLDYAALKKERERAADDALNAASSELEPRP